MASSPNYRRNYHHEYEIESAKRRHDRVLRNAARRKFLREGKVHKHDGNDVDHKKPLGFGGDNRPSNLRVRNAHANRSYHRTHTGHMKYKNQK